MARSHYTYAKRQLELKKKKKREEKSLQKQQKATDPADDAAEYLAMLRGETIEDETSDEAEVSDTVPDP